VSWASASLSRRVLIVRAACVSRCACAVRCLCAGAGRAVTGDLGEATRHAHAAPPRPRLSLMFVSEKCVFLDLALHIIYIYMYVLPKKQQRNSTICHAPGARQGLLSLTSNQQIPPQTFLGFLPLPRGSRNATAAYSHIAPLLSVSALCGPARPAPSPARAPALTRQPTHSHPHRPQHCTLTLTGPTGAGERSHSPVAFAFAIQMDRHMAWGGGGCVKVPSPPIPRA
jgi:hypothetical protein